MKNAVAAGTSIATTDTFLAFAFFAAPAGRVKLLARPLVMMNVEAESATMFGLADA